MKQRLLLFWAILALLNGLLFVPQLKAEGIGMVTGSKTGTYIKFGRDIAKMARKVGLDILVKKSEGSLDNIRLLVSRENAAFGIVQSDVLGFLSGDDDPATRRISGRLRLVFPFYNEEVHLFARREIRRFEDLDGKRVVVGTRGSGNWVTSTNLLRMLDVNPAERVELSPIDGASAVLAGDADAMFYVAGKPVQLFTNIRDMEKDPRYANLVREVHFVPLNHEKMLQEYVVAAIGSDDYEWLDETVPTVAVKAVLVSFDFSSKRNLYYRKRCEQLSKLGRVIRDNFAELQQTGHRKWKEVDLDEKIGIWRRDSCSQMVYQDEKEDGLIRDIRKFLEGK
jgi:TRAP transporter TAXI family solute receptor